MDEPVDFSPLGRRRVLSKALAKLRKFETAAMEGVRAGGLLWYPLRFGRDGRYQLREQVDGEGRKEMGVLRVVGI